jgi:hypothetical protein
VTIDARNNAGSVAAAGVWRVHRSERDRGVVGPATRVRFVSDPAPTSVPVFAIVGREENGSYFG